MRQSVFAAVLAIVIASVSCKKNDEVVPNEPSASDFMNLKVGNYWVYEFYKIDTNGVETKLEETDSAYILKDTVINGLSYFIKIQDPLKFQKGPGSYETQFLRDSSGYLVDNFGVILFAQDNFTDTLSTDTISSLTWNLTKMTGKDSVVHVPAGSFVSRTICRTWYPLVSGYPWGVRRNYTVYGKDAGILKYNYWFYTSGDSYEARLLRYKK